MATNLKLVPGGRFGTHLKLAHRRQHYEQAEPDLETKRPFRIWDAAKQEEVRYHYFSIGQNAVNYSLTAINWASIGTSFEVYDRRTAAWICTHTKKVGGISQALPTPTTLNRFRKDDKHD